MQYSSLLQMLSTNGNTPLCLSNLSIDKNSSTLIDHTNHLLNVCDTYVSANETKQFKIDESSRIISFAYKFKNLRSIINFLLNDTVDMLARVKAAKKVMCAVNFISRSGEYH